MATDRWMRHDRAVVKYTYVVFLPLREALGIISTILLLWGNYIVIWRELEDMISAPLRGAMWFGAKCGIFILTLLSILYLVLRLSLGL